MKENINIVSDETLKQVAGWRIVQKRLKNYQKQTL